MSERTLLQPSSNSAAHLPFSPAFVHTLGLILLLRLGVELRQSERV